MKKQPRRGLISSLDVNGYVVLETSGFFGCLNFYTYNFYTGVAPYLPSLFKEYLEIKVEDFTKVCVLF